MSERLFAARARRREGRRLMIAAPLGLLVASRLSAPRRASARVLTPVPQWGTGVPRLVG